MKKYILFLILFPASLISQDVFTPISLNKNYFGFSVERGLTSSFYDYSGSNQSYIQDSISPLHDPQYSYTRTSYVLSLKFSNMLKTQDYGEFGAHLNLNYRLNNMETKYRAISDSIGDIKSSTNYNHLSHLNFGFDYRYRFSNLLADFELNCLLPFGNKKSVIDDTGNELLGDGYLILSPALNLYYISEKYYAMLKAAYNFNSEEINDDYSIVAGIGLISIKEAALSASLQYTKSLGNKDEGIAFDPFKYQLYQESFRVNLGFELAIVQDLIFGVDYSLVLNGNNTQIFSVFRFNSSYMINLFKNINM